MKKKRVLGGVFLLFLIFATIWIVRFRGTTTLRTAEGAIFGTTYHIKYEAAQPLDKEILEELNRVDASLSVFNQQSAISLVNQGKPQSDAMLYEVLTKAHAISEATQGAFDVTVMPLVNAWGFGFKKGQFPSDSQIDSLRTLVGYNKVVLNGKTQQVSTASPGVMIDCGAIAKGYGVDRVAKVLREHGVLNYMVEIGGEVVTKGRNPEGHEWQIGVSKPIDGSDPSKGDLQTVLSLQNAALATSGNYRNFYEHNGRKYAHTIDPRTGRPVQHSLLSATVMALDCATADAYATAFMVLGLDGAKKVLAAHKELRAYLIYANEKGQLCTYVDRMPVEK